MTEADEARVAALLRKGADLLREYERKEWNPYSRSDGNPIIELIEAVAFEITKLVGRIGSAVGGMFGRNRGGGDEEADEDAGFDAGAMRAQLEDMEERLEDIQDEWAAAANLADGLRTQIEEASTALEVVTRSFGTQHAKRTAANLGRHIASLSEEWDGANADAERLGTQVRDLQTAVQAIARSLEKSMPEAFEAKAAAPAGAHAIYR